MKTTHIYWFAHYNLVCPSVRYRGKYALSYLSSKYGVHSSFVYPDRTVSGAFHFFLVFFEVLFFRKKDSLIVIQKVCSEGFYANALKMLIFFRSKNTQYDLDDAEYLRKETKTLHFFLKKCKRITVGSTALKKYCLNYNSNVCILTSPICNHSFEKKNRNKKLHIGWVGDLGNGNFISKDFTHKKSMFRLFFPDLKQLNIPIKLILIGVKTKADIPEIEAYFEGCSNIELEMPTNLEWEEDSWLYPKIAEFDIGVSPLVNHPFTQAKSAFKAKQYLSVGVPCIASDIGENNKFVLHGKNGFLYKRRGDFLKYIQEITVMNNERYSELSACALKGKKEYSIESYCNQLIS